jgi:hypothetical protein
MGREFMPFFNTVSYNLGGEIYQPKEILILVESVMPIYFLVQ